MAKRKIISDVAVGSSREERLINNKKERRWKDRGRRSSRSLEMGICDVD